ncbi:hypothetical protein BCR35DRAFT_302092 [Leucosporidium creatinivorum]|uniref:Uncharacterized protein n=1 Tax=Leucosporidium creatinivorum TaxID=106004 RepID=A0A1Y2FXV9_9BASI|nr:hypothetical protein BCR35DRAFT_302092 [Leucosporidium creatinivorum]
MGERKRRGPRVKASLPSTTFSNSSITIDMHLPCKRTRSSSPPFDLVFPSPSSAEEGRLEPAVISTSSKRLAGFTSSLKHISTIHSSRSHTSQPSTPPSTPSLSRRSSSSSASVSSLNLNHMAQPSFVLTPPPSPKPSRARSPPSALHEQAKRIFETHYLLIESPSSPSPSPPYSPTIIALDEPTAFERRTPIQATTVQECTVM